MIRLPIYYIFIDFLSQNLPAKARNTHTQLATKYKEIP